MTTWATGCGEVDAEPRWVAWEQSEHVGEELLEVGDGCEHLYVKKEAAPDTGGGGAKQSLQATRARMEDMPDKKESGSAGKKKLATRVAKWSWKAFYRMGGSS